MDKTQFTALKKKYDFGWEVLDMIVSGRSSIDSTDGFNFQTPAEVDRYVAGYGYDLENPIEASEIFGNFHESINFIRKYFLQPENPEGLKLEMPRKILEITNVSDLFMMASLKLAGQSRDIQGKLLQTWACAILKVMHTIAHMDQDLRHSYFADVQKQIFDRYYKVVHRDEDGALYLGESPNDPLRVNLAAFETKPKKSRDSTLIKLMHKPENVAEDIFDRAGLRFVTYTRFDAIRVLKYLKTTRIVMPPNVKPSRSRNTLVDLGHFREQMDQFMKDLENGKITESEFILQMESAAHPPGGSSENPHTSQFYRAIQFTCRQLIKLKNPVYQDVRKIKELAKGRPESDELIKAISQIELNKIQKEIRFFFPYEVQVVDQKSFEENEKGRSAHSEYKKSQLQSAMKRVMGNLVNVGN